jgi:histidinol-phosphate/aromatic aminotransferase/cobyric acid decarboxylase-like protein
MDRNSLVTALAQASQQEVDRIFEVIASPDGADNSEITTILNSYGLETNEIPYDAMGRISEINSLVVQDVDIIANERYPDIPYEDIKQALAQFTPEEAAIALGVIDGTANIVDLNNALRDNGVTLGDGYLS